MLNVRRRGENEGRQRRVVAEAATAGRGKEITLFPTSSSSSSIVPISSRRVVTLRSRPVAVHAAVADPAVGMPVPLSH